MEDYEKLYKDVLAKAREIHRNENEKRSDMEWLFPELKESENERVKKRILLSLEKDLMATKNSGCDTQDLEQCIAWLEKQGKQKHPVIDFKANNWYVSKVDGKIHDMTYNPTDKVEPKFKVKYAGSEYNVFETKDIAGVPFYGIEDEPNHIDYVQADNCEIISGYAIKENGSSYPTNPAVFSEQKPFDYEKATITQKDFAPKPTEWSDEDENYLQSAENACEYQYGKNTSTILWLKSLKDRVQPKPKEWSEEDEEMAEDLIKGCVSAEKAHHFLHTPKEVANWLKSLKDRIGG